VDTLIFYKEKENLKETIQQIRFSQQRPYTLHFAESKQTLQNQLKAETTAILFYFSSQLNQQDRIFIQTIHNQCPAVLVCLCSSPTYALDAWKLDVFYFLDFPVTGQKLKFAYQKYIRIIAEVSDQFSIKTSEGVVKIPFRDLQYLKANGNYTSIYIKKKKPLLITKQLNQFMFLTEQDSKIQRMHRSFIFNLRNIKTVGKKEIIFYGSVESLAISQSLAIKLKQELLGKSS